MKKIYNGKKELDTVNDIIVTSEDNTLCHRGKQQLEKSQDIGNY